MVATFVSSSSMLAKACPTRTMARGSPIWARICLMGGDEEWIFMDSSIHLTVRKLQGKKGIMDTQQVLSFEGWASRLSSLVSRTRSWAGLVHGHDAAFSLFLPEGSEAGQSQYLGLPSLQKCVCEMFGEIWFGIRFEILRFPIGKIWWNFGGELFYLSGKHEKIRGKFRSKFWRKFGEKFGNFISHFATFFGKLVKQKGGANNIRRLFVTMVHETNTQINRRGIIHVIVVVTWQEK